MPGFTYRATGSVESNGDSSALNPTSAGEVNDLLLLYGCNRASGEVMSDLAPNWQQIAAYTVSGSLEIWARVADGSAADEPTVDWSGTSASAAWIEAYEVDGTVDLGTLVVDTRVGEDGPTGTDLPIPPLTPSEDNAMLVALTRKNKSAVSDDATTVTFPAGLTKRSQVIISGTASVFASATQQQTTATAYSGDNATVDGTPQSLSNSGIIMAIKAGPAEEPPAAVILMGQILT